MSTLGLFKISGVGTEDIQILQVVERDLPESSTFSGFNGFHEQYSMSKFIYNTHILIAQSFNQGCHNVYAIDLDSNSVTQLRNPNLESQDYTNIVKIAEEGLFVH